MSSKAKRTLSRLIPILLLAAGAAGTAWMVSSAGADGVWSLLSSLPASGLAAYAVWHLCVAWISGLCWRVLWRRSDAPSVGSPLFSLVWARMVRDAGGDVLPLSQAGGFVLGGRAAFLSGFPATFSAATTAADVALEAGAQILCCAIGAWLLFLASPGSIEPLPTFLVLAGASAAVGGFVAVQCNAVVLSRGIPKLGRFLGELAALEAGFKTLWRDASRWAPCLVLHLAGWFLLAGESWLGLRLLGRDVAFQDVVAMEGMVRAVRSAAFAVPAAVGVQEGATMALGLLVGLDPAAALALSLMKRARDVAFGVPSLLFWQAAEARALAKKDGGEVQEGPSGALSEEI